MSYHRQKNKMIFMEIHCQLAECLRLILLSWNAAFLFIRLLQKISFHEKAWTWLLPTFIWLEMNWNNPKYECHTPTISKVQLNSIQLVESLWFLFITLMKNYVWKWTKRVSERMPALGVAHHIFMYQCLKPLCV